MNRETARRLCELNTAFYRSQYESFAQTRARPWQGWNTCLEHIQKSVLAEDGSKKLTVFDLACGNLRFEVFLETSLPKHEMEFYAVDNCEGLVGDSAHVHFQYLDIIEALFQETPLAKQYAAPPCDLSVSFGFLHHVPLKQQREEVLMSLIEKTRPGGLVIITLWQFLKDSNFAKKAEAAHRRGVAELDLTGLGENDLLLGWKDTPGVYRYCHSFSDCEVDDLAQAVAKNAQLLDRFTADGRSDSLNTYLVFQT